MEKDTGEVATQVISLVGKMRRFHCIYGAGGGDIFVHDKVDPSMYLGDVSGRRHSFESMMTRRQID